MPKHVRIDFIMKMAPKHRNQLAQTPTQLIEHLEQLYGKFDFDPCPPDPTFDGLTTDWGQNTYVNPPFNDLKRWLQKALDEWKKGKQVVFLMPIRIHTEYFLDLILPHLQTGSLQMFIIRGGVKFQKYTQRAPFGMMYLLFSNQATLA